MIVCIEHGRTNCASTRVFHPLSTPQSSRTESYESVYVLSVYVHQNPSTVDTQCSIIEELASWMEPNPTELSPEAPSLPTDSL